MADRKIRLGVLEDGTVKAIDLDGIHNLLIAGGNETLRNVLLSRFISQIGPENCRRSSETSMEGVSNWARGIKEGSLPKDFIYIIDDFAERMLRRGKSDDIKACREAVDFLASHSAQYGINIILLCGRPCVDVLTKRLKHLFCHVIAMKTLTRVDSYSIIDMPTAAEIQGCQLVYRDENSIEIINS